MAAYEISEIDSGDGHGSMRYLALICIVAALGGVLFGYDTAVISGANDPLVKRFKLDDTQEGWVASCALIGCMIGVALAGWLSDWLGRKKALILSAIFFLISAIGTALPETLDSLVFYRIVGGVGVGAASMTSPLYIAEVSPARVRGRMVSVNQLAIVSGMVVVYFVNYFIGGLYDETWQMETGWRWMFGSEALPAMGLLVALFFVPESPRWLTKQGRDDEAMVVLERVNGRAFAREEVASIRETLKLENGSWRELLDPRLRLVLVIGLGLAILQQVTGINVFLYYTPKIFENMGAERHAALLNTIAVGGTMALFAAVAIWTVDWVGRKPLMLLGSAGMGVCLFVVGLLFFRQTGGGDEAAAKLSQWQLLLFTLGYIAFFSLSVGPVTWVILSEIFPTQIRGRAMGLVTFFLWGANYVVSQTFPMLMENKTLNSKFHGGLPFWIYGGMCVVLFLFLIALVPETKGKTLESIESMWLGKNGRRLR